MSAADIDAALKREMMRRELPRHLLAAFVQKTRDDYVMTPLHRLVCRKVQEFVLDIERGLSPRLMIFMAPRLGKSHISSFSCPAWALGRNPSWECMTISYGDRPAKTWARRIKRLFAEDWYKEQFPELQVYRGVAASDSVELTEFTAGGNLMASSIGGSTTGMGGKCLVLDDPIKDNREADSEVTREYVKDFYLTSLETRVNRGRGGVLLLNTRWHESDLAGWILSNTQQALDAGEDVIPWQVLTYPAIPDNPIPELNLQAGESICEAILPLKTLQQRRNFMVRTGRRRWWNAMYQQQPVPDDGDYFRKDWFAQRIYNPGNELPAKLHWYLPMDLAFTEKRASDFTCIWPFGIDEKQELWFAPNFFYGQGTSLYVLSKALQLAQQYDVEMMLLEKTKDSAILMPVFDNMQRRKIQEGKLRRFFHTELLPAQGDKPSKCRPIQGLAEAGLVHLPDLAWVHDVALPELMRFPVGAHDDICDCLGLGGQAIDMTIAVPPPEPAKPQPVRGSIQEQIAAGIVTPDDDEVWVTEQSRRLFDSRMRH